MKSKKKLIAGIMSVLIFLSVIIYGIDEIGQVVEKRINDSVSVRRKVYLITKGKDSDFWSQVYAGARTACAEYNMELIYLGPDNEEDYQTQNLLIDEAVNNDADAIVFSAIDYEKNAEKINWAANQGVIIINIDSEVDSKKIHCYIGTDNYEAGKLVGESITSVEGKITNVGIVNFMQATENGKSREKGVRDSVLSNPQINIVTSVHVESSIEETKNATINMIEQFPQIDYIIALNELLSIGVGNAIKELGKGDEVDVIAFDNNKISIEMLETGEVDALVVQAPYAMGYLGVENAYKAIGGEKAESDRIDTVCNVITKENMYTQENQRLLFGFD